MGFLDATGITTLVTKLKERFVLNSDMPGLLATKQDNLVSGTNIKTVGGYSLVGGGNVAFPATNYTQIRLGSGTFATALEGSGSDRIWFTSTDGTKLVPINTSTSSSLITAKTLNTTLINPFMPIYYCSFSVSAGEDIYGDNLYIKYPVTIGYSYVKTLTATLPVFVKCSPKKNGSAELKDIVQALPTTDDEFVYIFLGVARDSSEFDLSITHPAFYNDGVCLRVWMGETFVHQGGSND